MINLMDGYIKDEIVSSQLELVTSTSSPMVERLSFLLFSHRFAPERTVVKIPLCQPLSFGMLRENLAQVVDKDTKKENNTKGQGATVPMA